MVEQTVDWAAPEAQSVAVAAYRQRERGRRTASGVALGLLIAVGVLELVTLRRPTFLIAAGVLGGFMRWIENHATRRLRRLAAESGVTTYRLDDSGLLHIDNALGSFHLPLHLIRRRAPGPHALTLEYADHSTMTLPNGPVRTALERSFA